MNSEPFAAQGPVDGPVRARVWARKDQLQAAQRGGHLCAMYPDTFRRADLEPLYDQAALDAAILAEREACAKVMEENAQRCGEESMMRLILETNAAAIRARSNANVIGLLSEAYERGKADGWDACETCHGIVGGVTPNANVTGLAPGKD